MLKSTRQPRRERAVIHPLRLNKTAAAVCAGLALQVPMAWAQTGFPASATSGGFSGLGVTPTAQRAPVGHLLADIQNQLPGAANPSGYNVVGVFGLHPSFEVGGRVATNHLECNLYARDACPGGVGGIRDLSGNAKAGFTLRGHGPMGPALHLAAGATDIGGAATNFRSRYVVSTYEMPNWAVSLGYSAASRVTNRSSVTPLDGPFASAWYRPHALVAGYVEATQNLQTAGLRLYAPAHWLPDRWQLHLGFNTRLNDSPLTERHWWGVGLSVPLYGVPSFPRDGRASTAMVAEGTPRVLGQTLTTVARDSAQTATAPTPAPASTTSGALPAPVPALVTPPSSPTPATPPLVTAVGGAPINITRVSPGAVQPAQLDQLAQVLQRRRFESLSIGRRQDGTVVIDVQQDAYRWNQLDALGAALGAVSRVLASADTPFALVVRQRGVATVAVEGRTGCLPQWIALGQGADCGLGRLLTPGTANLDSLVSGTDVQWTVRKQASGHGVMRLSISPALRTRLATEYGTLDYSAGVRLQARVDGPYGLSVEAAQVAPVVNSDDYSTGGGYADQALKSRLARAALVMTHRIPLERLLHSTRPASTEAWGLHAVTGAVSVGRIDENYQGVHGEVRWEPGDGRHRFSFERARLESVTAAPLFPVRLLTQPSLLHYRFNLIETRSALEFSSGTFLHGDKGWRLGVRQWFADTSVTLFYRRSDFDNSLAPARQFAGLEFSMPIGRRVDPDLGSLPIRVQGTSRFAHTQETVVRAENRANFITLGYGERLPSVLDAVHNSDRSSALYHADNLRRIRDAAALLAD